MNDQTQITVEQSQLDTANDAYQRLFNYFSQCDEQTRDLALADLQAIIDTTATALTHADEQTRRANSLKGVLDDARMQIAILARKINEQRAEVAEKQEQHIAIGIAYYMGIDLKYARAILDALLGIEESYWIDENLIDDLRESIQRIEADMQDADMLDALNERNVS